jgi:hypothetical protein
MNGMEVEGAVAIGEFQAAQRAYVRQVWGSVTIWLPVLRFVVILPCIPVALMVTALAKGNPALSALLGFGAAAVCLGLGTLAYARLARWITRRAARRFGLHITSTMTVRATQEALTAFGEDWRLEVGWPSVVEVICAKSVWVFACSWSVVYLPRRFFPDLAVEREFMKLVSERLDASALKRSPAIRATVGETV